MERNCLWKGSQLEKKQCKLCASQWAGAEFPLLEKHKEDKEVRQGTLVLQPLFYELHFFNFGKEILGNYGHLWWSLTDILVCIYYKLILQNDLYLYMICTDGSGLMSCIYFSLASIMRRIRNVVLNMDAIKSLQINA